jgi:hypothetical protein
MFPAVAGPHFCVEKCLVFQAATVSGLMACELPSGSGKTAIVPLKEERGGSSHKTTPCHKLQPDSLLFLPFKVMFQEFHKYLNYL